MILREENQIVYKGENSESPYSYPFKVFNKEDIKLIRVDAQGNMAPVTSDYRVNLLASKVFYPGYEAGAEEPEADRPAPLGPGEKLIIYRDVPVTQDVELPEQYPFNLTNNIADKACVVSQQIKGETDRALKVNRLIDLSSVDLSLPVEAGKGFRWDDECKKLVSCPIVSEDTIAAYNAAAQSSALNAQTFAMQALESVAAATNKAIDAYNYAQQASEAVVNIDANVNTATSAANTASAAATSASASANTAAEAAANVGGYAEQAQASASAAAQSATDAASYVGSVGNLVDQARTYSSDASHYATEATDAARTASTAASVAQTYSSSAASSAGYASISADSANSSANEAKGYARTATTKADEAAASEAAVTGSVNRAEGYARSAQENAATTVTMKDEVQIMRDAVVLADGEIRQEVAEQSAEIMQLTNKQEAMWKLMQGINYEWQETDNNAYSVSVPLGAKECILQGLESRCDKLVVRGKNLIPPKEEWLFYQSYGNSYTTNGITFMVNDDGSVTMNGTATAAAIYNFNSTANKRLLHTGSVTLSQVKTEYTLCNMQTDIYADGVYVGTLQQVGANATKTFNGNVIEMGTSRLNVYSGATLKDYTVYPQIELGSVQTSYSAPKLPTEIPLADKTIPFNFEVEGNGSIEFHNSAETKDNIQSNTKYFIALNEVK